jgi:hypothetical protein
MLEQNYDSGNIDLLWGCRAIADFIGRRERQVFHLLETGQLPARKVGATWVAQRRKLREFFEPGPGEAARASR